MTSLILFREFDFFKPNYLLGSTPHRIEELFTVMPLVILLPTCFTIELNSFLIASVAPECLLLHTAFLAVDVFIAFTVIAAFLEGFFCANTSRNRVTDPWIFCSCEAEEKLAYFFRVPMPFVAFPNTIQDLWCKEPGVISL